MPVIIAQTIRLFEWPWALFEMPISDGLSAGSREDGSSPARVYWPAVTHIYICGEVDNDFMTK